MSKKRPTTETAAEEIVAEIDAHELMQIDVSRATSADFLGCIISSLQSRLDCIEEEMRHDEEPTDG